LRLSILAADEGLADGIDELEIVVARVALAALCPLAVAPGDHVRIALTIEEQRLRA
jgi:hypothetical protein